MISGKRHYWWVFSNVFGAVSTTFRAPFSPIILEKRLKSLRPISPKLDNSLRGKIHIFDFGMNCPFKFLNSLAFVSSVFMIVINCIKMTKVTQCSSVHDESSCFSRLFTGHLLKLHAESRWNQSGVTVHAKYQIPNPKSVSYESEMNTIWTEVDKEQNGKKKNPRQSSTSLLVE